MEQEVPVRERALEVYGQLSDRALQGVSSGLPAKLPANSLACFLGYCYVDLPLGKSFEVAYTPEHPQDAFHANCIVVAVTQQFAVPLDHIPHGWKTIAILRFDDGVPDEFLVLPVVDGWNNARRLMISSRETLLARGGGEREAR
ncbi:MAG: hypothetical protein K0U98_12255 [Deltaproteobacteria bacterium]|nr:hypothetical protein [Deltaproteobacteria bacterium]